MSLLPNHLREKAVPVIVVETSDSEENEAIENFSQPLKIGDAYSYYVSPLQLDKRRLLKSHSSFCKRVVSKSPKLGFRYGRKPLLWPLSPNVPQRDGG